MANETHSNDDKARKIFSGTVKFDHQNNQYITPLPFNGKEEFLNTNEFRLEPEQEANISKC